VSSSVSRPKRLAGCGRSTQTLAVAREGHCNAAFDEIQLSSFNAFWSPQARAVRPSAAGARWSLHAPSFNARANALAPCARRACPAAFSAKAVQHIKRRAFVARGRSAKSSLALRHSGSRRCCSKVGEGCPSFGGQRTVASARGVFNATAKYTGAVRAGRHLRNQRHG
jgi:hypothetical protein